MPNRSTPRRRNREPTVAELDSLFILAESSWLRRALGPASLTLVSALNALAERHRLSEVESVDSETAEKLRAWAASQAATVRALGLRHGPKHREIAVLAWVSQPHLLLIEDGPMLYRSEFKRLLGEVVYGRCVDELRIRGEDEFGITRARAAEKLLAPEDPEEAPEEVPSRGPGSTRRRPGTEGPSGGQTA